MSSVTVRLLRENYQGFAEFKKAIGDLQRSEDDPFHQNVGIVASGDPQHEESAACTQELLNISTVCELEKLCAIAPEKRDTDRCAEICSALGFFPKTHTWSNWRDLPRV